MFLNWLFGRTCLKTSRGRRYTREEIADIRSEAVQNYLVRREQILAKWNADRSKAPYCTQTIVASCIPVKPKKEW
jgi:hypothetical protein